MKQLVRPEDLSVVLTVATDDSATEFWNAKHTCLHLAERSPVSRSDKDQSRHSLIAAVGCQDGSIWLIDTGVKKLEAPTAIINVEDVDSVGSSKPGTPALSIKDGSPMLSRTSSYTLLHNAALSPPSVSKGELATFMEDEGTTSRSRKHGSPSLTSPTSKSESFAGLGFLPVRGTSGKTRSTSVSQDTASARLASISAADDKALRIRLNHASRDSNEVAAGSLMKLVGDARGGLEDLHGKSETEKTIRARSSKASPRDIKVAAPPRRTASEIRDEEKVELDYAEAMHEEEEMERVREAVENAEEKACRDCGPNDHDADQGDSPRKPFLARILPTTFQGNPIIDIRSLPLTTSVIALSERGVCTAINLDAMTLGDKFDIEDAWRSWRGDTMTRPNLNPPHRWRGLLPCSVGTNHYFVAYAHSPTDSAIDQAKDLTTVALLAVKPKSHSISAVGFNTLPGQGQIAVAEGASALSLLHLCDGQVDRYEVCLSSPAPEDAKIRSSRSHVDLKSFFTPLPTRPHSRAGQDGAEPGKSRIAKEDPGNASDFGRMLGKKLLGRSGDKSQVEKHEIVFMLGPASAIRPDGILPWSGIRVDGSIGIGWTGTVCQLFSVTKDGLQLRKNVAQPGTISAIAIAPELSTIAIVWESKIVCLDTGTGEILSVKDQQTTRRLSIISTCALGKMAVLNDELLLSGVGPSSTSDPVAISRQIDTAEQTVSPINVIQPFRDAILVGDSNGRLCIESFLDALNGSEAGNPLEEDPDAFEAKISCLRLIPDQTEKELIFAGYEDGSMRVWDADNLRLRASCSVFADQVQQILITRDPKAGRLVDKILLTSRDGSMAVFGLGETRILYVIPGSEFPIHRAIAQKDDLIIISSHGRARVWNLVSGEFRRSTSVDAAAEMLAMGEWLELPLIPSDEKGRSPLSHAQPRIELGLDRWENAVISSRDWISSLHETGISQSSDDLFSKELSLSSVSGKVNFGLRSSEGLIDYRQSGRGSWKIGSLQTLIRQLCLITALHRLDREHPTSANSAHDLIAYYGASLPSAVGHEYADIDIDLLVAWYNHGDPALQHSAHLLLDTRLARMSDSDVMNLADSHIGQLPVNVASSMKRDPVSCRALTLLGATALSRYTLMKPATLKDIALSIMYILKEGNLDGRLASIDFAQKGFDIWQAYIDPADMLRSLFDLAVMKEEDIKGGRLMAHARTAVLQLASSAGALFISTVTLDIVTAETVPRRNAIMKLCVFIARKKPTILLPSLPRLAEAVVKSLDPTRVRMRESIQQTATVILNELVSTFPSIDFAGVVQKLAVGTQEGAVIMYDLKTATRLYVLETHHHPVSALSFSPDGRRLVTASLAERRVTIWKVGSSFSGFLNVGGPPRQGSGSGEPFKSLDFFVADPGKEVDPATGQQKISFSWPGDRQACLHIGQMKLTFAT